MHPESKQFMDSLKNVFPEKFGAGVVALDVGSQDINGNNRYLFDGAHYLGLDIGPGPNVDIVDHVADFSQKVLTPIYDTVISTNAFEHDSRFGESLQCIIKGLVRPGGLFAFVCAAEGTPEHGTAAHYPQYSPHTNDYYKNQSIHDVMEAIDLDEYFRIYHLGYHGIDLRFWGIKK